MTNINQLHYPKSIRAALDRLNTGLPHLVTDGVFRRAGRSRAARRDFLQNVQIVLKFCISHYDLVTGNILYKVSPNEFITITPTLISEKTGLCTRTIKRIFKYLIDLDLLEPEKQRRPIAVPNLNGYFMIFTSVCRRIKDKLFQILGVLSLVQKERSSRLNRELVIRRATTKRYFLGEKPPSQARLSNPPTQNTPPRQKSGPTSLADVFKRAVEMGIPIPSAFLSK